MLIQASVRPRNMKRGITTKKLCHELGFNEEVGLTKICGRLDLSATRHQDFGILVALLNALSPVGDDSSEIVIKRNGKEVMTYKHEPKTKEEEERTSLEEGA